MFLFRLQGLKNLFSVTDATVLLIIPVNERTCLVLKKSSITDCNVFKLNARPNTMFTLYIYYEKLYVLEDQDNYI